MRQVSRVSWLVRQVGWLSVAFCLASQAAVAGLVVIAPPPSVQPGALESNTDAFLFAESSGPLSAPLAVDISMPGLYNNQNPNSPGTLPAGVLVQSYMLHRESVDNVFTSVLVTYTFPYPVLGIITSDVNLDLSDPIVGNPGTAYPTGLEFRGMEMPYMITPDSIFWSGNQVTITVFSNTALILDHMRVLVAIPEPTTWALAGMGGALLAVARIGAARRRQQRHAG